MIRSRTTIPFHNLTFHDDLPKLRNVEKRLRAFLKTTREAARRGLGWQREDHVEVFHRQEVVGPSLHPIPCC